MSLLSFRLFAFVFSLFRYGAFVMSPRNKEKTKWHKSATIRCIPGLDRSDVQNDKKKDPELLGIVGNAGFLKLEMTISSTSKSKYSVEDLHMLNKKEGLVYLQQKTRRSKFQNTWQKELQKSQSMYFLNLI